MRAGLILKVAAALVVALIIAAVAIVSSIDVNRYKGLIEAKVEEATGRQLSIAGDLEMSLGLTPAVVVNGVQFANAPWGSQTEMVQVERFEAEVALIPALTGDIQVERLVLVNPTILLETGKNGQTNWTFDQKATPVPPAGTQAPGTAAPAASSAEEDVLALPALNGVSIENGKVILSDARTGETTTIQVDSFTADADDLSSPLDVALAGAVNGLPVEAQGVIGPLRQLTADEAYPVALKGEALGVEFSADGTIRKPLTGEGLDLQVAASTDDLSALATLVEGLPALPALSVAGHLTGGGKTYRMENLDLSTGSSKVTGTIAIDLSGRKPAVDAALQAALVDLRELLPSEEEDGGQAASGTGAGGGSGSGSAPAQPKSDRVFPREPLPLDGLHAVDAKFDVAVAKLVLPDGVALEGLSAKGSLTNGRLTAQPVEARLGGGSVTAALDVDASSGQAARLSLNGTAQKVELGSLFAQIGQFDLVGGAPADAEFSLSGQGSSVAGLAGSLDGRVLVTIGQGTINNALIDWAGADVVTRLGEVLTVGQDSDPNAELTCGVINVKASGGRVAWDRQIAFQTSRMNVVSSGEVDLGRETLDVAVRPYAREGVGLSAGRFADMLRLQGSLADPKVGIDPVGAAGTAVSVIGALATGGVSLLGEALYDRSMQDTTPCQTALTGEPPATGGQAAQPAAGGAQAAPTPQKLLEDLGKGLGDLFKR